MKFTPLAFGIAQMQGYTSELPLTVEYKFRQHHSVQITATPVFPNFLYAASTAIFSCYDCSDPYWLFGGRGMFAYRYYFNDREEKPFGWYLGGEVSVNGMSTKMRVDRYRPDRNYFYTWSVENKVRAIISTYSVTGGIQLTKERDRGTMVFNITGSLGYNYSYFWRKYSWGNLEFPKNGERYGIYKKYPIWAVVNIQIGGLL